MENNERTQLNRNWLETAELLGLAPEQLPEPPDERKAAPDAEVESWVSDETEETTTAEEETNGGLGETMPELESANEKDATAAASDWSDDTVDKKEDAALSFSISRTADDTATEVEAMFEEEEDDDDEEESVVVAESESFDEYDEEVEVHIEEFLPDKGKEYTLTEEEPEEKRRKKGRKRGRRGKKGKKPSSPEEDVSADVEVTDDDEDVPESGRRKKRGRKGKKEKAIEETDDDDIITDWTVPSWNELISSLYRPD